MQILSFFYTRRRYLLFVLFSISFLYFTDYTNHANIFLFLFSGIIIGCYLFSGKINKINLQPYILIVIVYAIFIAISAGFHFTALFMLPSQSYVTVEHHQVLWGLQQIFHASQLYFFFPLLILSALYFFQQLNNACHLLYGLALLWLPSIFAAFYQAIISAQTKISGFSMDESAFGILLFLFFPLTVLGLKTVTGKAAKFGFSLLLTLLIGGLIYRDSRTALIGIFLFIMGLYLLPAWCEVEKTSRRWLKWLIISCIAGTMAIICLNQIIDTPLPKVLYWFENQAEVLVENGLPEFVDSVERRRLQYGVPAFIMSILYPIAGVGPGGFYIQLNNMRYLRGESFLPIHNTANQYLQMSTEFGLPGLLLNLFLHLFPIYMIFRVRNKIPPTRRWGIGIAVLAVIIMMIIYITGPHVLALDVAWVMAVLLGFLASSAVTHGYVPSARFTKWQKIVVIFFCVFFVCGAWQTSFGKKGYHAWQNSAKNPVKGEYGFYNPPENIQGVNMIWADHEASRNIEAQTGIFGIKLMPSKLSASNPNGGRLEIRINDELYDLVSFFGSESKIRFYYEPALAGKKWNLKTSFFQKNSPVYTGLNRYYQHPTVAVSELSFLEIMPPEGLGFFEPETWKLDLPVGWPADKELDFRWTHKRAAIRVEQNHRENGLTLLLRAEHLDPDVSVLNVVIEGQAVLRQIQLIQSVWRPVFISAAELKDVDAVRIVCDRTWNPRLAGLSEDDRDLGVVLSVVDEVNLIGMN